MFEMLVQSVQFTHFVIYINANLAAKTAAKRDQNESHTYSARLRLNKVKVKQPKSGVCQNYDYSASHAKF